MTVERAGLCATCRHVRVVAGQRSSFLRCGLSDVDPRFPRYPGLPVLDCPGHDPMEALPGTPEPPAGDPAER